MLVAPLPRLAATDLDRALRSGIHRLLGQAEHLDRINVFPVPDGDTGTNLAITMSAVLTALRRTPFDHAGRLFTAIADAALDGARGNSGAILAQFLLGLGDRAGHLAELSTTDFAAAMHSGATYAREALSDPREGTILTVAQDVAVELGALASAGVDDFRTLLRRGVARAQQSLDGTRGQLDVLQKANVVDAGAAGFVTLLEGMSAYLDTGELDESDVMFAALPTEADAAGADSCLEHRWCTECMVSGPNVDPRLLRERLAEVGSSLVVAGTKSKVRVHIHVTQPAEVFRIAAEYGDVSGEKADDMQRQQASTLHAGRRKVAIVTDSAGDLPDEELERLDIHLVPIRLHFGDRSFLDKVSLSQDDFYRMLETSPIHPKTSQPPAGDFRRVFEFLASHHESVVSINVTGRVSGTHQSAESAAGRGAVRERVTVIDSLNASAGQGLLTIYAAECADLGMNAAEVADAVRAMRPRTRTFAFLASLDAGVRGGRVPSIARTLGKLLRISPLLASFPDGRITIGGALVGRSKLTAKFARFIGRRLAADRRYRLIVAHGGAPEQGRELLERLTAAHPNIERAWLVSAGAALGVHGGRGFLVAGFQDYVEPATLINRLNTIGGGAAAE